MAEKSEEKAKEAREQEKKVALKNLKGTARNVGLAYLIHNSPEQGEIEKKNVYRSFVLPYYQSEEFHKKIEKRMSEGPRFGGGYIDSEDANQFAEIYQRSLQTIDLKDLLNLAGIKNEELAKLPEEIPIYTLPEDLQKKVIGNYIGLDIERMKSEASKIQQGAITKNLEKILVDALLPKDEKKSA